MFLFLLANFFQQFAIHTDAFTTDFKFNSLRFSNVTKCFFNEISTGSFFAFNYPFA